MSSTSVFNKKKQVELKVCQKFVRCFNSKYEKRYSEPELVSENREAPDCISTDIKNPSITYQFEVTKSSPKEAENMGKDGEHEFFSESRDEFGGYLKQAAIIYDFLKSKATKYSSKFKTSLIILLEGATIDFVDSDIEIIASKVFSDRPWQEKLKGLGFKEIWYVSTKDIFQLFPT